MNRFLCSCSAPLEVDDSVPGQVIVCATCGARMRVPKVSESGVRALPRLSTAITPGDFQANPWPEPLPAPEVQKGRPGTIHRLTFWVGICLLAFLLMAFMIWMYVSIKEERLEAGSREN